MSRMRHAGGTGFRGARRRCRMKRKRLGFSRTPTNEVHAAPQDFAGIENAASLPAIVAGAFERLNLRARARMLGRLLASVGPLALAVVGGGAFAKYVTFARLPEVPVSFEDAALPTSTQLAEIARYGQ